jgi:hypothetical protein
LDYYCFFNPRTYPNGKIIFSAVYHMKFCPKFKDFLNCPGGVVQWTLHPPQEQEDPGSNPTRV